MRPLNPEMSGNSLSQFRIYGRYIGLAVQSQKAVPFGKSFKLFLDLRLI